VIFLDTGFLLALVSERDENHGRTLDVLNSYRGGSLWDQVVTTNHVVAEATTAVRCSASARGADRTCNRTFDVIWGRIFAFRGVLVRTSPAGEQR